MSFNATTYQQSIRALSLPVPDSHTLSDIFDIEGDVIVQAIDAFKADNERAKKYLKGILYAVTPATKERLARRGLIVPSMGVLISIGRYEGPDFSAKLKTWDESGQDNCEEARYVRLTLARYLESASKGSATPVQTRLVNNPAAPAATAQSWSSVPPARQGVGNTASQVDQQRAQQRAEAPHPADPGSPEIAWPENESESGSGPDGERYKSFHVYGGKFAACFSEDTTQRGIHTIRVEATEASGQRTYNWKNKVAIQLSQRELPLMLATLMLWTSKFEAKGHGQNNEKWMTLEAQPGKLYLSVQRKGTGARGVAIAAGDAYPITTMIVKQMLANDPFLTADLVFKLAKKQIEIMQHGV
ncbi:hypothetical protein KTQ42_20335 [Noviherbaspirillum sp. L7-7A]|uniref:hypothetical protein n=1 Tax=Noviherbaspirillum sp. L7-7A TaxID=2850560 RepID=UPI001C2CC0CA|nr:hypothetical protein [Noviherbaspirillum sp. L7-7A]MBV0881633.1 hypothetical protein [Noviherbaspirillum sp. L7-7A]